MDVPWITAFIDRPADGFAATVGFWCAASGSTLSPWRGEHDEFATFLPADGADAHLRVQRTQSGTAASHLDLHVVDVRAGADECLARGASMTADHDGYVELSSPGGMPFCLVAHRGEGQRQTPVPMDGTGPSTLVDQVCIDADPDAFDEEVRFWSSMTGWAMLAARTPEFVPLERPAAMPLRLLLQRRADPSGPTSCHLDLACDDVTAAAAAHVAMGASSVAAHRYWRVMADPSGTEYCLTSRQPATGQLAPEG